MTAPASGFRTYVIVWFGQFASLVGTNLSSFALGIYVYWLTGSVTALGFVFAFSLLPSILASPIAGSLVDRWGSQRALMVSNAAGMVITSVLVAVLLTDNFAVWQVYVFVAVRSVFSALQFPAFGTLAPLLVPKQHLGRANGMRMFAMAASEVLAPMSAGALLLVVGVHAVVLLDFASFGLAILTLLMVRIPRAGPATEPTTATGTAGDGGSVGVRVLLADFRHGWHYVAARRGLLALLLFLAAVNFSASSLDLLLAPLVLAFASSGALGAVLSIGGVGMIVAGLAVSVWGGPRRKVLCILWSSLVLAMATIVGAARPNVALIAIAAFAFMAALAVIISTNMTIWQTKVEPHMLGRVMAILNMVGSVPQLIAYVVAGLAVDRVFGPLVGREEVRSSTLARFIGDGPGRGVALMMMVMGVLIALSVVLAAMNPRLRRLEAEVLDVTPEPDDATPGDDAGADAVGAGAAVEADAVDTDAGDDALEPAAAKS